MASMVKKGINSFKFFMAYKGALMVGDELLLDGLQRCKELGALAMVNIKTSSCASSTASVRCDLQLYLMSSCYAAMQNSGWFCHHRQ